MLRAAGEEVALLALFDTMSLAGENILPLGQWLKNLGSPRGSKKMKAVRRHLGARLTRGYRRAHDRVLRAVLFPVLEYYRASGRPLPLFLRRPDRCNRLMLLELRNMPPYEGDAVYFKAETGPKSMAHPDKHDTWDQIIKGRLTYVRASGGHHQMMSKANVPSLARNLTEQLARARGEARAKTGKTEKAILSKATMS